MNKLIAFIKNLPWWTKNVYFVSIVTFIFWMMFLDRNNLVTSYNTEHKLNELLTQKAYYQSEIEKVDKLKAELFSTSAKKEKFAREKYLMKKDNEDIFIIVENNDD